MFVACSRESSEAHVDQFSENTFLKKEISFAGIAYDSPSIQDAIRILEFWGREIDFKINENGDAQELRHARITNNMRLSGLYLGEGNRELYQEFFERAVDERTKRELSESEVMIVRRETFSWIINDLEVRSPRWGELIVSKLRNELGDLKIEGGSQKTSGES